MALFDILRLELKFLLWPLKSSRKISISTVYYMYLPQCSVYTYTFTYMASLRFTPITQAA